MQGEQWAQLAQVAAEWIADRYGHTAGIMVGGSRVNGVPGPRSDFDVFVATDGGPPGKHSMRVDDVEIDVSAYPVHELRRAIQMGHAPVVEFVATSLLLAGGEEVARLHAAAVARFADGPDIIDDGRRAALEHRALSLYDDVVDDLDGDPAGATVTALFLIMLLGEFALRLRRIWIPAPKRLRARLGEADALSAAALDRAVSAIGTPEMQSALEALFEAVFGHQPPLPADRT